MGLGAFLRRFGADRSGLSALEFALIAPVMIVFFLGTAELDTALTVDRRVTQAANTVADLAAQDDVLTQAEIDGIFASAAAIMAPYDRQDRMQLCIASVRLVNNQPVAAWSVGRDMTCDVSGTPRELLAGGATVIMATAGLDYEPPLANYLTNPLRMEDTFYLRPRRTQAVCRAVGNQTIC